MTYQRPTYIYKIFVDDISQISELENYDITYKKRIKSKLVILSKQRILKNKIQKLLSLLLLMRYSTPQCYEYLLTSKNFSKSILCRLFVVGDHVYGFNIYFENLSTNEEKIIIDKIKIKLRNVDFSIINQLN